MPLPLGPGRYEFDRAHSQFSFSVTHLGITPIVGMFADFEGALIVGESAASSSLEFRARMASVSSGNAARDAHIQGEDFFDTANYPELAFRTTELSGDGDHWTIEGDLVVKAQVQTVRLAAEFTGKSVFPMDKKEHIGATATGTLSRLHAGVGSAIPESMLSDDIPVSLAVQLIKTE